MGYCHELCLVSGKDASADYENIGHSSDARDMMVKYLIGTVDASTLPLASENIQVEPTIKYDAVMYFKLLIQLLIPIVCTYLAFLVKKYWVDPQTAAE